MRLTPVRTLSLTFAALIAVACSGAPSASSGLIPTLPPFTIPPVGSFAIPSVIPNPALEAMFPDEVGGHQIEVQSASGLTIMGLFNGDPAAFNRLAAGMGTTVDKLNAAISFGLWPGATASDFTGLTMTALQAPGVPAATIVENYVTYIKESVTDATASQETIGGKAVTAVVDPGNAENTAYIYGVGDVAFAVGGTPALVEEALSKLP